jgi:cytochrome oxidase Cu insertion factor (SCO1/SenC/PrrC family)
MGTAVADYVPLFYPRLIGLTGSAEPSRRVALAYKVFKPNTRLTARITSSTILSCTWS